MVLSVLHKAQDRTKALTMLLPVFCVILFSFLWVRTDFYQKYPALVMITTGIQFFLVIIKMIISTVTEVLIIHIYNRCPTLLFTTSLLRC